MGKRAHEDVDMHTTTQKRPMAAVAASGPDQDVRGPGSVSPVGTLRVASAIILSQPGRARISHPRCTDSSALLDSAFDGLLGDE